MEKMNKLKFESLQPLIGEWDKYLTPLFEGSKMYDLYQEFKPISSQITPIHSNLYRFLLECPPSNLKLIIIGMDSYPGRYKNRELQATGLI
jgi:uracil DNA glycosylase